VLKHVARLWGFGVQIESVGEDGALPVLLHSVPAPSPDGGSGPCGPRADGFHAFLVNFY
jgi:hypothetical protein